MKHRRPYKHSAYWYAYHNGWTHSEAKSLVAQYWDMHTYRPRKRDFLARLTDCSVELDSSFNPLLLAACAMVDIGNEVRDTYRRWATPEERTERRKEITCTLRRLRRPFYYARETERRRLLAAERRKLHRRRTLAPMPTPETLLDAWNHRKESKERMIVLGGMLHDLECYVDNCLRIDEDGKVVGRNGGIRGWIADNLPELSPKYKTLMHYKAMAIKLRQVTKTIDPMPTEELLREKPKREFIAEILADGRTTFESLVSAIDFELNPESVLTDKPKMVLRVQKAMPRNAARRSKNKGSTRGKSKTVAHVQGGARIGDGKRTKGAAFIRRR